jgi:hypothetical protein
MAREDIMAVIQEQFDELKRLTRVWARIHEQVGPQADNRKRERAWDAVHRARVRLARTRPQTPAEAAALLTWIKRQGQGDALAPTGIGSVIAALKTWG